MKTWDEVVASPEWATLPEPQRISARLQYFSDAVLPKVPAGKEDAAWMQFDQYSAKALNSPLKPTVDTGAVEPQGAIPQLEIDDYLQALRNSGVGRAIIDYGIPKVAQDTLKGISAIGDYGSAIVENEMRKAGIPQDVLLKARAQTKLDDPINQLVQPAIKATEPTYQPQGYVEDVAAMVPQVAGQVAASLIGGPVGGAASIGLQILGQQHDELVKQGVEPQRAFTSAFANALMQAPLEQIGIGKAMSVWKPQRAIIQRFKDTIASGATEGITEFAQKFPEVATNIFALNPDMRLLEQAKQFVDQLPQTIQEGAYEGAVAAPLGALLGGVGGKVAGAQEQGAPQPTPTPAAQVDPFIARIQEAVSSGQVTREDLPALLSQFPQRAAEIEALFPAQVQPEVVQQDVPGRIPVNREITPAPVTPAMQSAQAFIDQELAQRQERERIAVQDIANRQFANTPAGMEALRQSLMFENVAAESEMLPPGRTPTGFQMIGEPYQMGTPVGQPYPGTPPAPAVINAPAPAPTPLLPAPQQPVGQAADPYAFLGREGVPPWVQPIPQAHPAQMLPAPEQRGMLPAPGQQTPPMIEQPEAAPGVAAPPTPTVYGVGKENRPYANQAAASRRAAVLTGRGLNVEVVPADGGGYLVQERQAMEVANEGQGQGRQWQAYGQGQGEGLLSGQRESVPEVRPGNVPVQVSEEVTQPAGAQAPAVTNAEPAGKVPQYRVAFHGSPYKFDKFTLDHIGKGEGAQAYGHGIYLASIRDVAEFYRNNLANSSRGGLSLAGVVPTSPDKGLSDNAWSAAKNLSEFLVPDSKSVKTFGSLDVVGQRRVMSMVRTLLDDPKVLDTVVRSVPVDVVNMLAGSQVSTDKLLNNPSMLIYLLPRDTNNLIPGHVAAMDILAPYVALSAAKVHTGLSRFDISPSDLVSANGTIHGDASKIVTSKIPYPSEFSKGQLYRVEIPESDTLLDWDKPLSEQPEKVKKALEGEGFTEGRFFVSLNGTDGSGEVYNDSFVFINKKEAAEFVASMRSKGGDVNIVQYDYTPGDFTELTGEELYRELVDQKESQAAASEYLNSIGIPGLRYLDGSSRGKGEGSYNYVIWDEPSIQVLETFYQRSQGQQQGQQQGRPIALDTVRRTFPGAAISEPSPGQFRVYFPKIDRTLEVRSVQSITPDKAALQVGWGDGDLRGDVIAGKYQDGQIEISRDGGGDEWTLSHESMHWLQDLGVLKPGEVKMLNARASAAHKAGEFTMPTMAEGVAPSQDEVTAEFYAAWRRGDMNPAGMLQTVLGKIKDFIDRIKNMVGVRTAGGVLRDIESGKVYQREGGDAEAPRVAAYSRRANQDGKDFIAQLAKEFPQEAKQAQQDPVVAAQAEVITPDQSVIGEASNVVEKSRRLLPWRKVNKGEEWGNLATMFKTIEWSEHPVFKRIAQAASSVRETVKNTTFKQIDVDPDTQESVYKIIWDLWAGEQGRIARHFKAPSLYEITGSRAYRQFADIISTLDESNVKWSDARDKYIQSGTPEQVINAVDAYRAALDRDLDVHMTRLLKATTGAISEKGWVTTSMLAKAFGQNVNWVTNTLKSANLHHSQDASGEWSTGSWKPAEGGETRFKSPLYKADTVLPALEKALLPDSQSRPRKLNDYIVRMLMEGESTEKLTLAQDLEAALNIMGDYGKNLRTLIDAYNEMGTLRGSYAPRARDIGPWVVSGVNADGERAFYRTAWRGWEKAPAWGAERIVKWLEGKGYTVEAPRYDPSGGKFSEADYNEAVTAVRLGKALEKMIERGTAGESVTTQERLRQNLMQTTADMLKARGVRASHIQRKAALVKGYIEDPLTRYLLHVHGTAGGVGKSAAAEQMLTAVLGGKLNFERQGDNWVHRDYYGKELYRQPVGDEDTDAKVKDIEVAGLDPIKNQTDYDTAMSYITSQLKNPGQTDRLLALAKSLASLKYLGFNLRSPLVNTTAMVQTAPAAIHQTVLDGKGSIGRVFMAIGKAGADYSQVMARKNYKLADKDEQAFIKQIQSEGYDDPQLTREAMGKIAGAYGQAWSKTMDAAMKLFAITEQWNRGSTMLAAFRLARAQGMVPEQAAGAAKLSSDRAHGIYGKATLPMWAQESKLGQAAYVYQKFGHNYMQLLKYLGVDKKNYKALAFAIVAPAVVGGAKAFIGYQAIAAILRAMMGTEDDPEKWLYDTVRENLGPQAEVAARYGLLGLTGANISGSLSLGMDLPKELIDLAGAPGGVFKDLAEGYDFLGSKQYARALEKALPTGASNLLRAGRERQEGVSTAKGRVLLDETGEPYKPTVYETGLRAAGFQPSRQAMLQERRFEEQRRENRLRNEHEKLVIRLKAMIRNGDINDQAKLEQFTQDISAHQEKVQEAGLIGRVPTITGRTISNVAKGQLSGSRLDRMRLNPNEMR